MKSSALSAVVAMAAMTAIGSGASTEPEFDSVVDTTVPAGRRNKFSKRSKMFRTPANRAKIAAGRKANVQRQRMGK